MSEEQKWQMKHRWRAMGLIALKLIDLTSDDFYDVDLVVQEAQRLANQDGIPIRVSRGWASEIFYPKQA